MHFLVSADQDYFHGSPLIVSQGFLKTCLVCNGHIPDLLQNVVFPGT